MFTKMKFAVKIFVFGVLGYQLLSNCGVCGIENCRAKLDMVIVVDSSLSVRSDNFIKVKAFIKDLIGHLPVHADGVRVGVVRYAARTDVITYLDKATNKTEKQAAVEAMGFRPGNTFTHLALRQTRTAVLTAKRGDRPDVPNLVILTTDGTSDNKPLTISEANTLKADKNLKIFVIGIGNEVNDAELEAVASRPEMVYKLTEFEQLTAILGNLARFSCSDMNEDSISDLKTWSNSESKIILPATTVSSISTASSSTQQPSAAPSTFSPTLLTTNVLTTTPLPSTATSLPVTSHSTYSIRSTMFYSTSNVLTNETTLPSTEFHTSDDNAFLSTTQEQNSDINEDLHNSSLTTEMLTDIFHPNLTTETETESTLEEKTVIEESTLPSAMTTYETEIPSSTHVVTKDVGHTSSTDKPADSTTQNSDNTTLLLEVHSETPDFDETGSTMQYVHTRIISTFDTTTAESSPAGIGVTQSSNSDVTSFTEPSSPPSSTADSSVSQKGITITTALASETTSTEISTQASTVGNTSSSFLVYPKLTTTNKKPGQDNDTLTSTISTEAMSELSQSVLRQTSTTDSWTSNSKITTAAGRSTKKLISRTSSIVTQTSDDKSQTDFTLRFSSTEPTSTHFRTSVDSRTTDDQTSVTSTQGNTVIVEYEIYDEHENKSNINKTNYIHGETGGDVFSRDVYIFVAGGSATAIILTAMSTFLAVLCRKRNRNRNLDAEP